MAKENENNKDVDVVTEEDNSKELKIAKEMAAIFAKEIAREKEVEKKEVAQKVVKSNTVTVKDVPFGEFKSVDEANNFAKAYIPRYILEKFNNQKSLTTYQNIGTDADGGSFDPTQAEGILADSVERRNSYIEDTLQVNLFNSVGTFIDHTSDPDPYMISEGTAGTESKPSNVTRTLTQKKILTLCPTTNEVFRFGSLADIASETLDSMGRAIATKLQHLIFTADGTADTTDGGITGIIPAITDVGSNDAIYSVTGAWDALTVNDIAHIVAQTSGWADPANFSWYCHKNFWGYLEGISRALGGNSYMVNVNQRPIPNLFGYPVKFVTAMNSTAGASEVGLLFGDLKGCIATGSNNKTYIDISPDFYFDADVTVLRAVRHIAVNAFQPGTNGTLTSVVAVQFSSAS